MLAFWHGLYNPKKEEGSIRTPKFYIKEERKSIVFPMCDNEESGYSSNSCNIYRHTYTIQALYKALSIMHMFIISINFNLMV